MIFSIGSLAHARALFSVQKVQLRLRGSRLSSLVSPPEFCTVKPEARLHSVSATESREGPVVC